MSDPYYPRQFKITKTVAGDSIERVTHYKNLEAIEELHVVEFAAYKLVCNRIEGLFEEINTLNEQLRKVKAIINE